MSNKYKILGISLIVFILINLFLLLRPKEGLPPFLLEAKNIDSIRIYNPPNTITVTSIDDIAAVSTEIKRCKKINPEYTNLDTGVIDLYFFTKDHSDPSVVRIMYNARNGIMINSNYVYYKNDSLNARVQV